MKIKKALRIAIDELDNAYCNEREHPEPRKDRVKELSQAMEVLKEHGSSLHELPCFLKSYYARNDVGEDSSGR